MASPPFIQLPNLRTVNRPELPLDLVEFYARDEGVGLEGEEYRTIRVARLDEVTRVDWTGLGLPGTIPPGWASFTGLLIGSGMYCEQIVYVLNAPCCPPGSILAIGGTSPGPGGEGPYCLERSLVLARSLADWLAHLERWGWVEYALTFCEGMPEEQQQTLLEYYRALNPNMNLGSV